MTWFTLSTTNAAMTFVGALGNGGDGEAIEAGVGHAALVEMHRHAQRLGSGPVERLGPGRVTFGPAMGVDDPAVDPDVLGPPVAGGDDPDAGQALLEVGQHGGDAIAHLRGPLELQLLGRLTHPGVEPVDDVWRRGWLSFNETETLFFT